MNDIISEFLAALSAEEADIIPFIASDNMGAFFRAAINELDYNRYCFQHFENPTPHDEEQIYLLGLGAARFVKLSLEVRPPFLAPVLTFRRDPRISNPVLQALKGLGMIEHGRRVAQTAAMGQCRIAKSGENEFTFTLPPAIPDESFYERALTDHYKRAERERFSALLQSDLGKRIGMQASDKLNELVYVWRDHFIGYDTDPLLDVYFFGLAMHEIQLCDGYDTFHFGTKFGGISFHKYILALQFVISTFLRHQQAAEALVRKAPAVKIENILTISADTPDFLESLEMAMNEYGPEFGGYEQTSPEEAKQIFEVLSLSRKNTQLLNRPGSPLPLMIQCSDKGYVRCITSVGNGAMQFLLDSLRFYFPKDYARHQSSREQSMQRATKRVLNEAFAGLEYLENIKIKLNHQTLTDIDLVVTDDKSGAVFLCQLKHQEIYGANLHSQQSRAARLREEASHWHSVIVKWMEAVGETGIRRSLRLKKSFPPAKVWLLVISRHHAYPLRELGKRNDTACVNWIQLVNAAGIAKFKLDGSRTLEDLIRILKEQIEPQGPQEYLPEPTSLWRIRDLQFIVEQEAGDARQ